MCGICCVLSTSSCPSAFLHSKLLSNLKKRGPDLSAAVENRVLCLHPVYETRCRKSPIHVEHYLSEGVDVERSDTSKDCQEYPLDPSISKENATSGELKIENDSSALQTNTENDADIHNTTESKGSTETTDFKKGSDAMDDKQRKQCGSSECNSVYGSFFGQVLHLRGNPTPQPVEDEQRNILLWNGEVFDGLEVQLWNDTSVLSDLLCHARNAQDILNVMGAIRGPWSFIYWKEKTSQLWFGRDFFGRRSLLWRWKQSGARTMTFGLSSVASKTETGIPVVSEWKEVPASGIFCLDVASWFSEASTGRSSEIVWYPWRQPLPSSSLMMPTSTKIGAQEDGSTSVDPALPVQAGTTLEKDGVKSPIGDFLKCITGDGCLNSPISPLNMLLPDQSAAPSVGCEMRNDEGNGRNDADTDLQVSRELREKAEELIRVLGEAVRKRVTNVPLGKEAVHASHQLQNLHLESHSGDGLKPGLSSTEPCFRTEEDGQEVAHRNDEERTRHKNHQDRIIHDVNMIHGKPGDDDPSYSSHRTNHIPCCHGDDPVGTVNPSPDGCQSSPTDGAMTASPGAEDLAHAGNVYQECDRDIPTCSNTSSSAVCCPRGQGEETKSSRVGVLFSGGLDSIVLAALADRYVPDDQPIDLFNVAFEQRKITHQTKSKDRKKKDPELQKKSFDVPDRLTGISGFEELQAINPSRKWNFVEIDVTLEELQAMRSKCLCHLIYPQDTVLDDSIGCAIWFAARGRGRLITPRSHRANCIDETYNSPAKVVLVGMGADEQLAGYSRHRSKFKSEGWLGLIEEIKMEVDRISARNLGRDDRVISDHGRESRLPYLDEDVVSFLNSLPINLKADLNLPRGVGEKLLLRVAAQRLGLGASSKLPKRAIQFGSRISKLENNREKASDRCNRLEQQVD